MTLPRLAVVLAALAVASTAQAASLSLLREFVSVADPLAPGPGDVVRVYAVADAAPDEQGLFAFGELLFSGSGAIAPAGAVAQTLLVSPPDVPWTPGATPCSATACTLFNQTGSGYTFATVVNTPLVIGSVEFTLTAAGEVLASWEPIGFTFFGISAPPGLCITCPIPEPATGALLALGLFALVTNARRTASSSTSTPTGAM